jgi:large subunit ribosomal protein L21
MPESTYAVVKCGGTQHRVEEGMTLLVDRLKGDEGASIDLEPLLYAGGKDTLLASSDLGRVKVKAKIVGHERGPKLRDLQVQAQARLQAHHGPPPELTRIEVTSISVGKGRRRRRRPRGGRGWLIRRGSAPAATAATPTQVPRREGVRGPDRHRRRDHRSPARHEVQARRRRRHRQGRHDLREGPGIVQFTEGRRGRVISVEPAATE